jgi:serine protease Do
VVGFRGTGVRITRVTKDSPADKAGIQIGDVVTSIDGQPSPSIQSLRSLISSSRPGTPLRLNVARDGHLRELTATLIDQPAEQLAITDRMAVGTALSKFGLIVRETDDAVVVRRVLKDSPADQAGFEVGQAILMVGGKAVSSVDAMCAAAAESGLLLGRRVAFEVAQSTGEVSPAPKTIDVQVLR